MRLFKSDVVDPPCSLKVYGAGPYNSMSGFVTVSWLTLGWAIGGFRWDSANPSIITLPRDGIYLVTGRINFAAAADFFIQQVGGGRVIESSNNAPNGSNQPLAGMVSNVKGTQYNAQVYSPVAQNVGTTGDWLCSLEWFRLGDRR